MSVTYEYMDDEGVRCDCESCGYTAKLHLFEDALVQGGKREDIRLCEVCSRSLLSIARTYPNQCCDDALYISIAVVANIILDRIADIEAKLESIQKEAP